MRFTVGIYASFASLGLGASVFLDNSPHSSAIKCRSEPSQELLDSDAERYNQEESLRKRADANATIPTIDTYFHLVTATPDEITDAQLQEQYAVLQADFAPHGIQFDLKNITKSVNASWADNSYSYDMKRALRQGDYTALNIFYVSDMGSGIGECTFPANSSGLNWNWTAVVDGCTVLAQSVPGGTRQNANLGGTTTHEVGHWFGLYHTFFGGCSETNDYVDDTPAQAYGGSPEFGCSTPVDSCPDLPGNDPNTNYMDYSGDSCYKEFTPGQRARMYNIYNTLRAPAPKGPWEVTLEW